MIHSHTNTDNTPFTYTNTNTLGQNVFFTGTGGAGNQSRSTTTSGNTQYYTQGAVGVSLQVFVNDVLVESIAGGNGNISTIADIKKHVRTENHRYTVGCGFLNLRRCWRDNYVQIWEWGHNRRAVTHRAEGQTKSFVLNIPPQGVLRVEFSGSSDSEHKGCCSISVLDKPLSLPFKPVDTNGIEWVEQEQSPQEGQEGQHDSSAPQTPQEGGQTQEGQTQGEQTQGGQAQGEQVETPQDSQDSTQTTPNAPSDTDSTDSTNSGQDSTESQESQESQGETTPQNPPAQDSTQGQDSTQESTGQAQGDSATQGQGAQGGDTETSQGGGTEQGQTESNPQENTNPQENGGQDSQESPQETPPIDKSARIAEIKSNALVAEFLDLRGKLEAVAKILAQTAGADRVFNDWIAEWFLNPANMAKFDDVPYNAKDGSITLRLGVAGWINKMQNLPEILSELKTKGMDTSKLIDLPDTNTLFSDTDLELRKFKRNIICAFWLANANRDSFENERNRYAEIYAIPEARVLIDELNTLEKS